jgi:hypothetical protein
MRASLSIRSLVVATVVAAVLTPLPLAAQKKPGGGGPSTEPAHWPCQLTFRDAVDTTGAPVDAIYSDGLGTYIHGQDGNRVRCEIVQAPNSAHDGWLHFTIDAASARYMNFAAREAYVAYTRSGFDAFQNRGTFDVKYIRDATIVGATYLRAYRSYMNDPQFTAGTRLAGDSFAGKPADKFSPDFRGTSSLFVIPLDECTWQVTSNPDHPLLPGEGATLPRVLRVIEQRGSSTWASADVVSAFSATVRVIGVKPGCGGS